MGNFSPRHPFGNREQRADIKVTNTVTPDEVGERKGLEMTYQFGNRKQVLRGPEDEEIPSGGWRNR